MGQALSIAPVSIEDLVAQLPAADQAGLAWLPEAVRRRILEPLRRTPIGELASIELELMEATIEVMGPLLAATNRVLHNRDSPTAFAGNRAQAMPTLAWDIDPVAAADLIAAGRWQAAISDAVARDLQADAELLGGEAEGVAAAMKEASNEPEIGFVVRGWMYLLAGIEELFEPVVDRDVLREWSRRALLETQASANLLRAEGFPVPISLPGECEVPPKVLRFLEASLSLQELWLFGSRARGVHGPESDWDLLAVVEDGSEPAEDDPLFRVLRRRRVDLFVMAATDFAEARDIPGTLGHLATQQGTRMKP